VDKFGCDFAAVAKDGSHAVVDLWYILFAPLSPRHSCPVVVDVGQLEFKMVVAMVLQLVRKLSSKRPIVQQMRRLAKEIAAQKPYSSTFRSSPATSVRYS
jgi:hypothetical protein